jgi:hypothetical protein
MTILTAREIALVQTIEVDLNITWCLGVKKQLTTKTWRHDEKRAA